MNVLEALIPECFCLGVILICKLLFKVRVIFHSQVNTKNVSQLRQLGTALRQSGTAYAIEVIHKTKVPIIKCKESVSNIAIDISFNIDSGIRLLEVMNVLLKQWEACRPLGFLLKQFLAERGMNEVYRGGVGSYAIISMIISFLQVKRD